MTKTKPKPRRTPEERRAQIEDLKQRYDAWLGAQDEDALAFLLACFDGYSPRNAGLILAQRPGATDVRGFREWITHGRQVRKGEKGIAILAPIAKKGDDQDGELLGVKVVYVFDVDQTDPTPVVAGDDDGG